MADVVGLDGLLKKLEDLPRVVAKKLIVRALRKGAEPIRKQAADKAPLGEGDPHLRDHMIIVVSDQTSTGATAKIGFSMDVFYGLFQEVGTAFHPPQPFLEPAFEGKKDEAVELIGNILGKDIEDETKI